MSGKKRKDSTNSRFRYTEGINGTTLLVKIDTKKDGIFLDCTNKDSIERFKEKTRKANKVICLSLNGQFPISLEEWNLIKDNIDCYFN